VFVAVIVSVAATMPAAANWRAEIVPAPGRVTAIETDREGVRVSIGKDWYRPATDALRLDPAPAPERPSLPPGALPDARIVTGSDTIARAWLAEPTDRYGHAVLGDAVEAGSLVIERRDGVRKTLQLGADAVFEDIEPRIARIGGAERIVVVKSYLDRGAAIAVIDPASASIMAESPPIGHANAWRNPAGIADYDGDGTTDIMAVRQPHVAGRLELWSFAGGTLRKSVEVPDTGNHVIGSRALAMSATADFDGDGKPDIAIPAFDRRALRLIAFAPKVRDIARVTLPSRIVTNLALVSFRGRAAVLAGMENGQVVLIRD
jgi:hypothetical protein